MIRGQGALVLVLLLGVVLSACGSSGSAAKTTPSPATGVDSCLVGKWRSTEVVALHTFGGPDYVVLHGKGGGTLTIETDGTWTRDYSQEKPYEGTVQGLPIKELRRGQIVQTIVAQKGKLAVTRVLSVTATAATTYHGVESSPEPTRASKIANIPYTCSAKELKVFADTYTRASG